MDAQYDAHLWSWMNGVHRDHQGTWAYDRAWKWASRTCPENERSLIMTRYLVGSFR